MKELKKKSHLVGIGLDNDDGHKRITQSDQFTIVGGSEKTHDQMTETVVKTVEDLKRKGKTLEETNTTELTDLIHKNIPR